MGQSFSQKSELDVVDSGSSTARQQQQQLFYRSSQDDPENQNSSHRYRKIEDLAKIRRAEETRQFALSSDTHDRVKENQQLLKKLFTKLDPTVTKVDTEVQGEMQVSLKCDLMKKQLLVKVIKCRDLGVNFITGKTADPYVAIALFPNPNTQSTKYTSVSPKAQNPVYNEIFSFHLDEVALMESKVVLQVLDRDIVEQDEFLGEVVIDLASFDFQEQPVHTAWYSLAPETDLTITGALDVRLEYFYPQSLCLTVLEAHDLKGYGSDNKPNPFVKVGVPGLDDIHVTEIRLKDCNPVWNEKYIFQIPEEEFNFRYIVLTVLNEDGKNENETLGHVVIDLDNFDPENGFEGTFPLTDMSNSDRLKNKWFQNATVQEFKEALWAHSFSQYPKLLFHSKHVGNKVVRLTCRKAGAKAKLSLVNGIPVV